MVAFATSGFRAFGWQEDVWPPIFLPWASSTSVIEIGAQYVPFAANVANALAIVRGATFWLPRILPRVERSTFWSFPSPRCRPTASAARWTSQKSFRPARDANVAVLIEW